MTLLATLEALLSISVGPRGLCWQEDGSSPPPLMWRRGLQSGRRGWGRLSLGAELSGGCSALLPSVSSHSSRVHCPESTTSSKIEAAPPLGFVSAT